MLWVKITVLLCFLSLTQCKKYYRTENDVAKYSFDKIFDVLEKSISCLERTPSLTPNATFAIAQTLGFLHEIIIYTPQFSGPRRQLVESIEKRIEPFLLTSLNKYPNYPGNVIWWPYYYGLKGNFRYKSGLVPTSNPLDKSLWEILKDTYQSDFFVSCTKDIITDNGQSDNDRQCKLKCIDEMTDMNYDSGIHASEKAWFFGIMLGLNCSNFPSDELKMYSVHLCNYIKQEVDVMVNYKNTRLFDDTMYYFNQKVLFCSSWGIPEFLSPKILSIILQKVDCNGCVSCTNNREDQQVLTAQTSTVLALTLRLIVEMDYKNGRI